MKIRFTFSTHLESVYDEGPRLVRKIDVKANSLSLGGWHLEDREYLEPTNGRAFLEKLGFKNIKMNSHTRDLEMVCEVDKEWLLTHKNKQVRRLAIDK